MTSKGISNKNNLIAERAGRRLLRKPEIGFVSAFTRANSFIAATVAVAALALSVSAVEAQTAAPVASVSGAHIIHLPVRNMVFDSRTHKIYATVGDRGPGATANTVTVIDPMTGEVGPSTFAGDDPGAIAIGDQSKYLFVSIRDSTAVRRLALPSMAAGPTYAMPDRHIRNLRPLAGQPNGFLAFRGNDNQYNDAVGIWIDGKLQDSEGSAESAIFSRLMNGLVLTNPTSPDFSSVNLLLARTITAMSNAGRGGIIGDIDGFAANFNGLLVNGGDVVDPETKQTIGHLNFGGKKGAILPDPRTGLVFCIGEGESSRQPRPHTPSGTTKKGQRADSTGSAGAPAYEPPPPTPGQSITACDPRTFQSLGTLALPSGVPGGAGNALRWDDDGFAYTVGDYVVIFRMNPGPLLPYVDLALERSAMPATLGRDNLATYRLTVTNKSASASSGVYLTDVLPPHTELVMAQSSQGSANEAGGVIRGDLGPLPAGAKATVDITIRFKEVDEVQFTAVARGLEPDPHPGDNIDRYLPSEPLSPLPDLTGDWSGLHQTSSGTGFDLQAGLSGEFVVRNEGKHRSQPALIRFYLSPHPRFITSLSLLLQEVTIPAIAPKRNYTIDFNVPLELGDATGHFVFAVIDPENEIQESTKSNNTVGQRIP